MKAVNIDLERMQEVAQLGRDRQGGHSSNLSPYGTLVQYLFWFEKDRFVQFLSDRNVRKKIFVAEEIEVPSGLDMSAFRNVVRSG